MCHTLQNTSLIKQRSQSAISGATWQTKCDVVIKLCSITDAILSPAPVSTTARNSLFGPAGMLVVQTVEVAVICTIIWLDPLVNTYSSDITTAWRTCYKTQNTGIMELHWRTSCTEIVVKLMCKSKSRKDKKTECWTKIMAWVNSFNNLLNQTKKHLFPHLDDVGLMNLLSLLPLFLASRCCRVVAWKGTETI